MADNFECSLTIPTSEGRKKVRLREMESGEYSGKTGVALASGSTWGLKSPAET